MPPRYYLDISSRYCKYRIRINDLECDVNHTGDQSGYEMPVNEYLRKGYNTIVISIEPNDVGEQPYEVVLMVKALLERRDQDEATEVGEYGIETPIELTPPDVRSTFLIPEDFPLQPFAQSPPLKAEYALTVAAGRFYAEMQKLFAAKDVDSIAQRMAIREKHFCEAYGFDLQERLNYVRDSIRMTLELEGATVLDIDPQYLEFDLFGESRLIGYIEKDTRSAAIAVYLPESDQVTYYPMFLGYLNGELSILK